MNHECAYSDEREAGAPGIVGVKNATMAPTVAGIFYLQPTPATRYMHYK